MREELERMYPFLTGRPTDPDRLSQALGDTVLGKARESRETSERFFAAAAASLVAAAATIARAYAAGGRLLAMGNGGSSCDAAHIAVEFVHPVTAGRPALAAYNLAADIAAVSAVGNDLGFEHVFVRQLVAHGRRGDVLIGVSTSGRSANIVAAFAKARQLGIATIALVGGDGHALDGAVDHCLSVPSTSIHRIQECHVAAYHILWDLVHTLLADRRGAAGAEPRGAP